MHPVDNEVDGNDISTALHAGAWLGKQLKKHTLEELGFIHDDYPTEDGGMEIPLIVDEGFRKYHLEKTTLPAIEDVAYPSPEYLGEMLIDKIRNKKGNGIVEVGTVYIPMSIGHNPEHVAPFIIPVLYKETGFVNAVMCNTPYDENPFQLLNELVDGLTAGGQRKPASIVCTDELTQDLLRDFCKKAGIMMAKTKKSKDFIQATYHIFASMGGGF